MAQNTVEVRVVLEGTVSEAVAKAIGEAVRQGVEHLLETPRRRALKRRAWRRTKALYKLEPPTSEEPVDVAVWPVGWNTAEGSSTFDLGADTT